MCTSRETFGIQFSEINKVSVTCCRQLKDFGLFEAESLNKYAHLRWAEINGVEMINGQPELTFQFMKEMYK